MESNPIKTSLSMEAVIKRKKINLIKDWLGEQPTQTALHIYMKFYLCVYIYII